MAFDEYSFIPNFSNEINLMEKKEKDYQKYIIADMKCEMYFKGSPRVKDWEKLVSTILSFV